MAANLNDFKCLSACQWGFAGNLDEDYLLTLGVFEEK